MTRAEFLIPAYMRTVNNAAVTLDSLNRWSGEPVGLMAFDAGAHIRQMLPQQVEALSLIEREIDVATIILILRESPNAGGKEVD